MSKEEFPNLDKGVLKKNLSEIIPKSRVENYFGKNPKSGFDAGELHPAVKAFFEENRRNPEVEKVLAAMNKGGGKRKRRKSKRKQSRKSKKRKSRKRSKRR